jgi:hypothetical protein
VAGIDQIDAVIRDKRQDVYLTDMIDVRIVNRVDMRKTGDMPLAAP